MKRDRDEQEEGQEEIADDNQGSDVVDERTDQKPTKRAREEEHPDVPQPMEQVTAEGAGAEPEPATTAAGAEPAATAAAVVVENTDATDATDTAAAAATIAKPKRGKGKRKAPAVPSWMGAERFTTPPATRAEAVSRLLTVFRLARAANVTVSPKSKDIWTCLDMPRGFEGRSQLWSLDIWQGVPLLCQVVQANNVELVAWLLEEGGAVVRAAKTTESPVTHAAAAGALDVLRYLVEEMNAPIPAHTPVYGRGENAVTRAAGAGHADVVLYCFEHLQETLHPAVFQHICQSALTTAVQAGHVGVVRAVLDHGTAQVHKAYRTPGNAAPARKPLSIAASSGQLNVVKYLVEERGVAANGVGPDGTRSSLSPLLCAAVDGQLPVVKWLLEGGEPTSASASETDTAGSNALMLAAQSGREEVVRFLADEGYCAVADTNSRGHVRGNMTTELDHGSSANTNQRQRHKPD
eukprot:m.81184 g.81184  ORF g.81184 m.81184 type:complete len:465 (-) comp14685_c0_seq4:238-1632(-)